MSSCVWCCELWSWVPQVRRMWQVRIVWTSPAQVQQRRILTFCWHWHVADLPIGRWS